MAEASKTTITSALDLNLDGALPTYEAAEFGTPDIASTYEALDIQDTGPSEEAQAAEAATTQFSGDIQKLREVNESYLRGEISGDVAAQLRRGSAEAALAGGLGTESAAARSLQARDFGMTSMQIQQQGMQQQTQIAELQSNLSSMLEQRSQFNQSIELDKKRLEEQSRQFSSQYGLDVANVNLSYATASEQSRQFAGTFALDAMRTQIARSDLLLKQDMFNKEQNIRMIEFITNMADRQATLQVTAAMGDKKFDMGPVNKIYDDLMSGIRSTLTTSNPGASETLGSSSQPASTSYYSQEQVSALPASRLKTMSAADIGKYLDPASVSSLTLNQVKAFTKAQIKGFTADQLKAFTVDQLKQFAKDEVKALSSAQLAALSPAQIQAISKYL